MNKKNYLIDEETHKALMVYKYRHNFKNMNETIRSLLKSDGQ